MRASRRTLAISSSLELLALIELALSTAELPIETARDLEGLGPSELRDVLMVVHVDRVITPELAHFLDALRGESRVIVVMPRGRVDLVIELMQRARSVVGMIATEDCDVGALRALATRVQHGEIFGLGRLLAPGTATQEILLADATDKRACAKQVLDLANRLKVPRRLHAHIEQCLDELVMNALYDAPVDDQGRRVFGEVTPQERMGLRIDQSVLVQSASDGAFFGIAVRDEFGTLSRELVLRNLAKGLHATDKIDRKVSGAGLGLYLVLSGVSGLYFSTVPGIATEVVCLFDLRAAQQQLAHFGVFSEDEDVTGKLAVRTAPVGAPRPIASPRTRRSRTVLGAGVAAAVLGGTLLIGSRARSSRAATELVITTTPPGAMIEVDGRGVGVTGEGGVHVAGLSRGAIYRIVARKPGYEPARSIVRTAEHALPVAIALEKSSSVIDLHSSPEGATVVIAGQRRGETPLELPAGAAHSALLHRPGYEDAEVPLDGASGRIERALTLSPTHVRLRVTSDPPGASVIDVDSPPVLDRRFTPTELIVEVGKPQHLALAMPEHATFVIPEFTVAATQEVIEKSGQLGAAATLHVDGAPTAVATIVGAPHCRLLHLPADCPLAAGAYTIEYTVGHTTVRRAIDIADRDVEARF